MDSFCQRRIWCINPYTPKEKPLKNKMNLGGSFWKVIEIIFWKNSLILTALNVTSRQLKFGLKKTKDFNVEYFQLSLNHLA